MFTKRKCLLSVSLLLLVTMMLSLVMLPAGAEGEPVARDISQNLLIHYDFEANGDGVLADKATAGAVKDNLQYPADMSVSAEEATAKSKSEIIAGEYTYSTALKIENGVVTSTAWYGTLYANASEDTKQVFDGEGTFFLRYKVGEVGEDSKGMGAIVSMRNTSAKTTRPFYYEVKPNTLVSCRPNHADMSHSFKSGSWANIAVVLEGLVEDAADANNGKYKYVIYSIGDDGVTEKDVGYTSNVYNKTDVAIYLFRHFEENNGYFSNWSGMSGVEIDDIRYYNVALTQDEMLTLVPKNVETDTTTEEITTPEETPTEEVTTEAATTAKNENDTTTANNTETNATGDEGSGCGSVVGMPVVGVIAAAAIGAAFIVKKKKND
ncbi:MAG: hypothetical protein IJZ80_09725 [Clostridia bacterium]|nr:hypothetical protein [Clostridia bacterium]